MFCWKKFLILLRTSFLENSLLVYPCFENQSFVMPKPVGPKRGRGRGARSSKRQAAAEVEEDIGDKSREDVTCVSSNGALVVENVSLYASCVGDSLGDAAVPHEPPSKKRVVVSGSGSKKIASWTIFNLDDGVQVRCQCGLAEVGNIFIACDGCGYSQHGFCIGVNEEKVESMQANDTYYCLLCKSCRAVQPPSDMISSGSVEGLYPVSSSLVTSSQDMEETSLGFDISVAPSSKGGASLSLSGVPSSCGNFLIFHGLSINVFFPLLVSSSINPTPSKVISSLSEEGVGNLLGKVPKETGEATKEKESKKRKRCEKDEAIEESEGRMTWTNEKQEFLVTCYETFARDVIPQGSVENGLRKKAWRKIGDLFKYFSHFVF